MSADAEDAANEQDAGAPHGRGSGLPRDLPDQQAGNEPEDGDRTPVPDEHDVPGTELPDTDETGSGPDGTRQADEAGPDGPTRSNRPTDLRISGRERRPAGAVPSSRSTTVTQHNHPVARSV